MAITNVTFIEEVDGQTVVREEAVSSSRFYVELGNETYTPAVVTNVEIENDGDVASTTDQCGFTTRQRTGDDGWMIRVQGIVTANDSRTGNLSLEILKEVALMSEITIGSDIISGTYEVSNTVITESSDLVSVQTSETEGEEQAFEFQMQLGETQGDG